MIEPTWPPDVGQMLITDFLDSTHVNVQKMVEDKVKLKVRWHLEKFVKFYLRWMKEPQNLEVFHAFIDQELIEMEKRQVCYFKTIANAGTYLFKRMFCYEELDTWKRCPLLRCSIAFPCWEDCPYVENDANLEYERETLESRYLECSEMIIEEGLRERSRK